MPRAVFSVATVRSRNTACERQLSRPADIASAAGSGWTTPTSTRRNMAGTLPSRRCHWTTPRRAACQRPPSDGARVLALTNLTLALISFRHRTCASIRTSVLSILPVLVERQSAPAAARACPLASETPTAPPQSIFRRIVVGSRRRAFLLLSVDNDAVCGLCIVLRKCLILSERQPQATAITVSHWVDLPRQRPDSLDVLGRR